MEHSVYVIDDEPWSVVDLMKNVKWSELNFEIPRYFNSSGKALESILQTDPDVVFTDIRMPVLSGLDLIREARSNGCGCKFVILSSYSEFEYAKEAIRFGVFDYCLKPIDPQNISDVLNRINRLPADAAGSPSDCRASSAAKEDPIHNDNLKKIVNYLKANFYRKVQLTDIAEEFFLNKNYICYLFQKYLNTTFGQYLTTLRLDRSKALLEDFSLSMNNIAKQVGFSDEFYFNKVFKKYTNVTPGVYRRSLSR